MSSLNSNTGNLYWEISKVIFYMKAKEENVVNHFKYVFSVHFVKRQIILNYMSESSSLNCMHIDLRLVF